MYLNFFLDGFAFFGLFFVTLLGAITGKFFSIVYIILFRLQKYILFLTSRNVFKKFFILFLNY